MNHAANNDGIRMLLEVVKQREMPKRTSINDVKSIDDLNDLNSIIKDKRIAKRAGDKKGRRNRHYAKVLIKSQLNANSSDPE